MLIFTRPNVNEAVSLYIFIVIYFNEAIFVEFIYFLFDLCKINHEVFNIIRLVICSFIEILLKNRLIVYQCLFFYYLLYRIFQLFSINICKSSFRLSLFFNDVLHLFLFFIKFLRFF
jgi:hypothetical protein